MERTPDNQQPAQTELDLTQMEPITPKKVIKAEPSFLDKAKGLFAKKESQEAPRFHERKEPTFGQTATVFTPPKVNEPAVLLPVVDNPQAESSIEQSTEVEQATVASVVETTEDVIQAAQPAPQSPTNEESTSNAAVEVTPVAQPVTKKARLSQPENWAIMQKLPEKHRRLFVAIAAGVLVLLALLWLKPSSETVEEIQANQSNSMPIEFQSLDPKANQTTMAVDNSQAAITAENVANNVMNDTATTTPVSTPTNNNVAQPTTTPAVPNNVKSAEQIEAEKLLAQQRREAEQARLEKVKADKIAAEKAKAEKLKEEQLAKAKAEKAKAEQQAKAAAEKARTTGAPVVEAKPASSNAKSNVAVTDAKKATTPTSASTKTLTVPKGVSLMQVFRDNNLNIGDVNAMSKAKGAENALSNFKAGDKVQVSVNSQGRVATMRLSNGATFTRQADGSYQYSK